MLPTKEEEIARYKEFLDSLVPGTYLHSMFHETLPEVASQIRSDIAIGPKIKSLQEAYTELQAEMEFLKIRSKRILENMQQTIY